MSHLVLVEGEFQKTARLHTAEISSHARPRPSRQWINFISADCVWSARMTGRNILVVNDLRQTPLPSKPTWQDSLACTIRALIRAVIGHVVALRSKAGRSTSPDKHRETALK